MPNASLHLPVRKGRLWPWLGCAVLLTIWTPASGTSLAADQRGDTYCAVPSASYPTLGSALADLSCHGADLASGDYEGSFTVNRSFHIKGPNDFSARILGSLRVEAPNTSSVGLLFVRVEFDADAGLIFADGFESGSTSAWTSTTP